MPHFKCETCRTRLATIAEVADVCEGCGLPLERVTELSELVGYQATTLADGGLATAIAVALRSPGTVGE